MWQRRGLSRAFPTSRVPAEDGTGLAYLEGLLYAHDAAALDQRLDAMARSVCQHDPRTLEQRRADALGALAAGADRLACSCGQDQCPAVEQAPPSAVVVHLIAGQNSLADDTPVQLDGTGPRGPSTAELREMTISEALAPAPPTGPAHTNPAALIGGGIIPAPLLAAKLATTATIRPLIHPGDAPPEKRYAPSRALADFVRCRDMTCRFPGCDEPAFTCDLDHTIPYPVGPTSASNLKCLCRKHRRMKGTTTAFVMGPKSYWVFAAIEMTVALWGGYATSIQIVKPPSAAASRASRIVSTA